MENTTTISSKTDEMLEAARALKLRNQFMVKGFTTRTAFIRIVRDYLDRYRDYHKVGRLQSWWLLRVKDKDLNDELEGVFEKLSHE